MKIKRYQAKDMRDAIRRVREEQGPDAVILSTERNAEGVVLIAAVDYDEALMHQAMGGLRQPEAPVPASASATPAAKPAAPKSSAAKSAAAQTRAPKTQAARAATPRDVPANAKPTPHAAQASHAATLDREIKSIKHMLEAQVARLAWSQFDREHPVRANLLRELTALGIANDIASAIVQQVPVQLDPERAARLPLGLLAKQLQSRDADFALQGGVIALVGPTGVGKTTTLAKLAARHVLQHGREGIALVTTDLFRIGGQDQLFHYGRLLGVPVYAANDAAELQQTLKRLRERSLVLVDTAGVSHRDMRLNAQLAMLTQGEQRARVQLVLSANQQAAALDDIVARFAFARPESLVLTKLDEAVEFGGALSCAIRHHLPVSYVTDGQRVPDDLKLLRAHQLVARAVDMVRRRERPGDDELANRFGGIAHALA